MEAAIVPAPGRADRRDDPASPALAAALAWIDAHPRAHAIVVALSRFDIVNAAYGRPIGDALLDTVEYRIRAATSAMTARIGGTRFLVATEDEAGAAVAGLGEALGHPFRVGVVRAMLGARFGVATREPGDDAAALVARAADALAAGEGGAVRVADPQAAAPVEALAIDLHHALARDEIAVLFQPQVRIADGRITAAEALARWDHPTLGAIGADLLFAAAERAGLGLALSDHVQQVALTAAAAWPASLSRLCLSINVTAGDIAQPGFAAAFLARVAVSGFAPDRLTAEITETALIPDLAAAAVALERLRAAGVQVAIDDFGTGYASFAYLKALPLDRLKIDRSLVSDIAESARGRAVVRGVVAMARALDLAVIAEGVETDAQRDRLADEGCGWYQGFLCSGAVDGATLARLVEDCG